MADKKIIAVTGATGAQGGGLAHAILDEPSGEFAVRRYDAHSQPRALGEISKAAHNGAPTYEYLI